MRLQTSSARKLITHAVLISILAVTSGDCPAKCHCTRYKILCSLATLNRLPTEVPETVELLSIELDNITQIDVRVGLHNISNLQLVNVGLQKIAPGTFKNFSRLERLSIVENNIKVLKSNSFKYLHNLYFLNLSKNAIASLENGAFCGLHNLRILDLSDNDVIRYTAEMFEGMRYDVINPTEYGTLFDNSIIEPEAFKYICRLAHFKLKIPKKFDLPQPYHLPSDISFRLKISRKNGIEYVNRNACRAFDELLYLDMSNSDVQQLKAAAFQRFTELLLLDVSYCQISKLNSYNFKGLLSLRTLTIRGNRVSYVKNNTFHGLQSLETLDISHCIIGQIESGSFEGLPKLRTLHLSGNYLRSFQRHTFSALKTLKELKLEGNGITIIDYRAMADFRYIKTLGIFPDQIRLLHLFNDRYDYIITCRPLFDGIKKDTFAEMERLDNLDLSVRVNIPKDLQVLKKLHIYIDAASVDPQEELDELMQTVRYVKELNVTLLRMSSAQTIDQFSEFRISTLYVICAKIKLLKNDSLIGLSKLKTLVLFDMYDTTIKVGAFHSMKQLSQLFVDYEYNLTYMHGSFLGLQNVHLLSIHGPEYSHPNEMDTGRPIKCLERGVFVGLDNLKQLDLHSNCFQCLSPGAFQGLDKIEEIDLSYNGIKIIEPGVFGALCKDEFEISCKNVTLPEYCNDAKALKSLRYLNLVENNISQVHPHAFVSCTNLHTLDFSYNRLLTLDMPFLYIPGLKKLHMTGCHVEDIPNNTFHCTPLLSELYIDHNFGVMELKVGALHPLKHLHLIDLRDNYIIYDCDFHEAWMWMLQHRVHYLVTPNINLTNSYWLTPQILQEHPDRVLLNMDCSHGVNVTLVPQTNTTKINDFAFFKQYIEPIVLMIILIFGLASNGFLLYVSLRHSDVRTKQNACIIHLAIVDVLSLVLNLPISYWDVVNIRWEFDETLCKIFIFSKDVLASVSVFSVVALSAERFLVARRINDLYKLCRSADPPTAWLLAMTWMSGIVSSLPAYYSAAVEVRCIYCPPGNQDYIRNVWTFQLVMYCLLPAVVIAFFNIKISLFLRESIRKIPGEIKENIRVKNRKTVANMVLVLVVLFLISFLPNYILRLLVAWSVVDMQDIFLPSFFTFCLFFFNTTFNPISLFIMSTKFKSHALCHLPFLQNIGNS